jgi:hypothetical protein
MGLTRPIACVLLLLVVLPSTAGCGSSNSPDTNKPQTRINPQDKAKAEQIIFHLSDFPAGWRAETTKDTSGTPKCFKLKFNDLTVTGKADSKDFVHGDVTRATSADSIYLNVQQAHAAFKRAASDRLAKCFSDYLQSQSTSDVKITGTSFGKLRFPQLGDESGAYQIAIELKTQGLTPTAYVDLVFIRQARALALLAFIDAFSPFDEQLKEQLARTVAGRMRSA